MISIEHLKTFYPPEMNGNASILKHILKEYVQLSVLDFLSMTHHIRGLAFIGGTCLRLTMGIDRFSEDLDFDCKNMTEDAFIRMSEDVITFLRRDGFTVEAREKASDRLTAFRRSLHFPGLLFDLGLTGHRDERFMLKLDAEDQRVAYKPVSKFIKGCGFFFSFPVPPDGVLCSMKIAAMLDRGKGRDFYDVMFLLARTKPDFDFLAARCGITNGAELVKAVEQLLSSIDLAHKQRDFEHLIFRRENGRRILEFAEFLRMQLIEYGI